MPSAHVEAQLRAQGIDPKTGKPLPIAQRTLTVNPRTEERPTTPPDPPAPARGKKTIQFRYQAATGEHTKQYPAYFRIVVEGPIEEQAAVEAALEKLKRG